MSKYLSILLLVSLFCLPSLAKSKQDAELVLWLPFDKDDKKVQDISQYQNDGVIKGAEWADGYFGKGLKFDAKSNTYVEVAASDSLYQLPLPTGYSKSP